ncbi:transcriptional regulator with XRE-family HTH domain [Natronocella acetinitrilica]|uniref:Transcriptional regulator with XRE-family HTH domain n=1 Tax=Natronocella acetinitrilica TaxID=414046 RepID=A0AAE3KAU0_9GAMM|nr:helix-turn-helix domain-containing protein [Natronocella acetinitrilica]MCP1673821.1 transcriptional regulator with XRE-family HTH domain [Natronocella acetinitrilica]
MSNPLNTDVERNISKRVIERRIECGITQERLAEAAGLTKGYISKIENGHVVPPIGTLVRIANALDEDVASFLKEPEIGPEDAVCVVRADERQTVVRGATAFGYDYTSLAHKKRSKHMEPFLFTFPDQLQKGVSFEHEGEEFIFVLSGEVEFEFTIDGEPRAYRLQAGDSLYFESHIPHRGRSLAEDARALVVIYHD